MKKLMFKSPMNKNPQDVKFEDGKYYAWNTRSHQWFRVAKTKVYEVEA